MAEYAVDHVQHRGLIEPQASIEIAFGPPTPGWLAVYLYARTAIVFFAPPTPSGPISPLTPGEGVSARIAGEPVPLLSPGIGPRAGFTATALRRRPIGPIGGAGDLGGGIFDPGVEPPPPPQPIDLGVFRVEVVDPRGTVQASSMGPMQADVPEPQPGPGGPAGGAAASGLLGGPGPRWILRVTNTSQLRADVTVNLLFHGQRPILTRDIDLDFLNEKLDLIFNVPQPFQIAFRNREVGRMTHQGREYPIVHSLIVLEASEGWRELHPDLAHLEGDLGARVFAEETASYSITVKATIHDGSLAFRARVEFPRNRGKIDVFGAVEALGRGATVTEAGTAIGEALVELTPADRPIISIRDFAFDVFLVLRPQGVYLQPAPTFEVITRPRIELDREWASVAVDALMQVAFERFLPKMAATALGAQATSLLGWLLGQRGREVTGSEQKLTLRYAGDPPAVGELTDATGMPAPAPLDPGNLSKIDRIVVVMLENRSFDHMMGFLSLPTSGNDGRVGLGRSDVDGLRGNETNPLDLRGNRHRVFSLSTPRPATPGLDPAHETRGTKFRHDPGHSYRATHAQRGVYDIRLPPLPIPEHQLDNPDFETPPPRVFHVGRNEGFIFDFARKLSGKVSAFEEALLRGEIMGYHPAAHVPTYRFLAEQYAICDRWFASHPGHTWPNRFVSLTGRLAVGADGLPQVDNPELSTFDPLEVATIFDHLTAAGVEWRYFEQDFCMLRLFSKYTFDTQRVVAMEHPTLGFFELARRGALPPVVYIEPDLTDIPPGNDDHPPSDIAAGQALIQRIYKALAEGPVAQWQKTLLIVTYDEHGGFYDHVHPESRPLFDPAAPAQGGFAAIGLDPQTRTPIDHYGFRVPTFVVSPWVPPATVGKEDYDHTSILKTIIARFMPQNPPNMGLRVALAKDVGSLLSLAAPRAVIRAPAVSFTPEGLDMVAYRLGPPEDDFRTFMSAMRARLRSPGIASAAAVLAGATVSRLA